MSGPPGALFVFIELGAETSEEEFHDMYETEHAPPRMALPEFVGGVRYRAADGQKPAWLGVFSVSDLGVVQSPKVAALMAARSEREVRIADAYAGLDRRAYALTYDSARDTDPSVPKTDGMQPRVALLVGLSHPDVGELDRWYNEEHLKMLRAAPGWVRSRRYKFVGGGQAGPLFAGDGKKEVPAFMALHEYTSWEALESAEFKAATSTEWRNKVIGETTVQERRRFEVFKVLK
ncbi:hypothetical protein AURDEDRAFT_116640 [Auricularia subglabra TFB-10046 SS5]|uniref:EthD domain-containing protein n=1 Tax=Auricularia subglabra (strain TFB-10046 / SS5) TaxID=717982 RepID=J0WWS3_AURST|nr:hypothetical protein AURDEDRAFT_116640 [Auricularia subglabra TFB-10046 SS5]